MNGHKRCGVATGVLVALLLCNASVRAQAGGEEMTQAELSEAQARSHFETGSLAFAAGRYEDALTEFRKAYGLSPRPKLLYNIAVAADRLRRDREALEAFEAYMQARPRAPEREEVLARIVVLRGAVGGSQRSSARDSSAAAREPVETNATAVELETAPEAPTQVGGSSSVAPWILLGAGALVTVVGGGLFAAALIDRDSVENVANGSRIEDVEAAHDRVPVLSTLGVVAMGVGVVTSGIAVTWLVTRQPGLQVEVSAGVDRLSIAGRF